MIFKQLTEQLLKFYIDTESVDDIGFENFFDDNSSIIGTGKHEFFRNLHEFQESYKFDVKQRGKIRLKIRDLQQEEAELGDDQVLAYGSVVFTGLFEDGSVCFEMDTRFSIIYKKVNGEMAGSASASVSTGQRPDDRGRISGYAGKTGGRGAPGN